MFVKSAVNFVFFAKNKTLGPVHLGCEASSSSDSLSMLKVSNLPRSTCQKMRRFPKKITE